MKKPIKAVVGIAFSMLCCGCMPTTQLEDRAIVQAAAVDYANEEFTLTLQIFTPDSSGENAGGSDSYSLLQSSAPTLTKAFEEAAQNGKEIYLGGCRTLLIGGGAAHRLRSILEYCNSRPQTRATMLVATTQDQAAQLLTLADGKAKPSPAKMVEDELALACKEKRLLPCRLMDVLAALETEGWDCLLPLMGVTGEKEKAKPVLEGAVAFVQEEPALTLTMQECTTLGLAQRGKANLLYAQTNPEAVVLIEKLSPKTEAELSDGRPVFTIALKTNGRISEYRHGMTEKMSQTQTTRLEEAAAQQTSEDFAQLLRRLCQAGCDPLRLGERLQRSHPKQWQTLSSNWEEVLKTAELEVDCRMRLTTFSGRQAS